MKTNLLIILKIPFFDRIYVSVIQNYNSFIKDYIEFEHIFIQIFLFQWFIAFITCISRYM